MLMIIKVFGSSSSQVEAIHQYHLQEDADLEDEGDVNMEDAEDVDDDPDYESLAAKVNLNDIMDELKSMRLNMDQQFDAQDTQFRKMRASIQR
jgi:hypothetical protein